MTLRQFLLAWVVATFAFGFVLSRPLMLAQIDHSKVEDCILLLRAPVRSGQYASTQAVQQAVWRCVQAHGLAVFVKQRDIDVRRVNGGFYIALGYERPLGYGRFTFLRSYKMSILIPAH